MTSIIPTQTARTIIKLDRKRVNLRQMRWQRIAREAAKQCARRTLPEIRDLSPWSDVLLSLKGFDLKLIACLNEKTQSIKDVLRAWLKKDSLTGQAQNKPRRIAVFIGPEGDFTPIELDQAHAAGCIAVSLGRNVLKSDTAAVSALAMITYELG